MRANYDEYKLNSSCIHPLSRYCALAAYFDYINPHLPNPIQFTAHSIFAQSAKHHRPLQLIQRARDIFLLSLYIQALVKQLTNLGTSTVLSNWSIWSHILLGLGYLQRGLDKCFRKRRNVLIMTRVIFKELRLAYVRGEPEWGNTCTMQICWCLLSSS